VLWTPPHNETNVKLYTPTVALVMMYGDVIFVTTVFVVRAFAYDTLNEHPGVSSVHVSLTSVFPLSIAVNVVGGMGRIFVVAKPRVERPRRSAWTYRE